MPNGYQVNLGGDDQLNRGDSVSGSQSGFTTASYIGPGTWTFSGSRGGTNYTDHTESGSYYLGTDGNVYFVPDNGAPDTISSAEAASPPQYEEADDIVEGSSGDDDIDAAYTGDPGGDAVDDRSGGGRGGGWRSYGDSIRAGDGDDTVAAGRGRDTIEGGGGDDSIDGGSGDDVIYGDSETEPTATSEYLDWSAQGSDGTNIEGGFTQVTGEMTVTVGMVSTGNNNPHLAVETSDTQYVAPGESTDSHSAAHLSGTGDMYTAQVSLDFAAADGSDYSDEVQNVSFRINDVDWASGNHRDAIRVLAYDKDGNETEVEYSPGTGDYELNFYGDQIVAAGNQTQTSSDEGGSLQVQIAGPVSRILIDYGNEYSGSQGVDITNIHFETVPPAGGDDTLAGGRGDDTMFGGAGDDTMYLAEGDHAEGGAGDDTFVLTDYGEGGSGAITIVGGEDGESGGDTLDLGGAADRTTLTYSSADQSSGTIEMNDGSVVTFSEMESVVCFTPGTLILTPRGERPVESLRAGDLVVTRDAGPRPLRWTGRKTVAATGANAPVHLAAQALPGARRPLLVSPQHRFLVSGFRAELLFGEPEVLVSALHLRDGRSVRTREGGQVTYIHLMFDRHEVIYAEGTPTESFHIGATGLAALAPRQRDEIFALFPDLRCDPARYGPTARTCTRRHEAGLLAA